MSLEAKLRTLAQGADVDVLVAMSPENFVYVSGAHIITVQSVRPRQAFAIIPRHDEPSVLVCSIEKSLTVEESWIKDVRLYTEYVDYPIDALVAVLKDKGLTRGRMGIDLEYLPQTSYARLTELLPDVEIVDTTAVVARMRAVKTEPEVAKMEFATKATHEVAIEAMTASHAGESEKTMANRLATGLVEKGADGNMFLVFGSGKRTALAHGMPTDKVVLETDIIRFDFGGTYGPWMSDFARTYSAGSPSDLQRETYRNVRVIQEETIEAFRPGIRAQEIFEICKAGFAKRGMPFHMPHVGHSFGVEVHEYPMLRPGDTTVLEPGMVINVEPIAIDEEGSWYHTEDLLVVTEGGYRLLTHGLAPKEIPVIGKPLEDQ